MPGDWGASISVLYCLFPEFFNVREINFLSLSHIELSVYLCTGVFFSWSVSSLFFVSSPTNPFCFFTHRLCSIFFSPNAHYREPARRSVPMAGWPRPGAAPSQVPSRCWSSFCSGELGGTLPDRHQPPHSTRLFGAVKHPELWSTFGVSWGKSLPLVQAGNSLHSIWAASLAGSEPL